MKLSEIKGERTLDVITELVEPIANIAQDSDVVKAMNVAPSTADGKRTVLIKRIQKVVPVLLVRHRKDVIGVMAAIEGVPAKEYEESLSIPKLIKDVMDVLTDEDLLGFFNSCGPNTEGTRSTRS